MESLFYVFIWILVLYDGPLGQEQEDFDFKSSILGQWSENSIHSLKVAKNTKIAFIANPKNDVLSKHVSPYFLNILPLAEKWGQIFRDRWNSGQPVDFDSLLQVTDRFLETMELEEPPDIINEHLTMKVEKDALHGPLPLPLTVKANAIPMHSGQKHVRNDNIQSMGDNPLSTLCKHPRL